MTTETQADFARRQGVNKGTVTRWRKSGRLVMAGELVDVEQSQSLLEQTKGKRGDLAELHRQTREEKHEDAQAEAQAAEDQDREAADLINARRRLAVEKARDEARITRAKADLVEMERDTQAGQLILKSDVDYVLDEYGATLRAQVDGLAERIGAEHGLAPDQIAGVAESLERMLEDISAELNQKAAA